jgi:hypothetical protein
MVLEHLRRLDRVVVNADENHVFFVHGRCPSVGSIGSIVLSHSLGESLSRAKITKMKTIFSPGENQHPATAVAFHSALTSDRGDRRISRRQATMR